MSPFRLGLVLLVCLGAAFGSELPESPWDEPVDYPGDPIPYSEVMRCVESDGAYEVDGITVSKDTIWVTDPNAISITANTTLEHDYVCVGNGFVLNANGITFDGDGHSITYGTTHEGIGVDLTDRSGNTIEYCVIVKNSMVGYSNRGIRLYESPNSVIQNNEINTNGLGNTGIGITESDNSLIQNNQINNNAEYAKSISLGSNQENVVIHNNLINTEGVNSCSIRIDSDSEYTLISNNTISSDNDGIVLGTGSGSHPEFTTIEGNTIEAGEYDIRINANIDNILLVDQYIATYKVVNSKLQMEFTEFGLLSFVSRFWATGSNLDSVITIDDNLIGVDTLNAPDGLVDTPATLTFYNPTIEGYPPYFPMMNGSPCPDSIYSNFQQSGDTLFSFDVTHMALEFSIGGYPSGVEVGVADVLLNPYPNPLSSSVTFPLALSESSNVSLSIYDISGRMVGEIWNGELSAGTHELKWDTGSACAGLSEGFYIARMCVDGSPLNLRLIILR